MAPSRLSLLFGLAALAIIILVPWFLVSREADRQGRSVSELISMIVGLRNDRAVSAPVDSKADRRFLERRPIGRPLEGSQPWISHVSIVDLDQDGFTDVVLCDATMNQVSWIRQEAGGSFTERPLGDTILAPAHVTPSDVDLDGDIDLLVAKMGAILPNNDKIGSVVVLENNGQEEFTTRILLDNLARVTDIEPGDFDGDGDIDLVVGQFGYDDGEIRWMENLGGWNFESHDLLELSGTIHTPVGISTVMGIWTLQLSSRRNGKKSMCSRTMAKVCSTDTWSMVRRMMTSAVAVSLWSTWTLMVTWTCSTRMVTPLTTFHLDRVRGTECNG